MKREMTMRITVAAVGRFGTGRKKQTPERDLFESYVKRLTFPVDLKEIEEKRPLSVPERQKHEADKLLKSIPKGAVTVALDIKGKKLTSEAFAERLAAWRDQGTRDLAFLIGGADGLDSAVVDQADMVLSLGEMTWPHLMVRGLLAEQLYRAQCIHTGHPYHRG